ncbi:hypothetical protein M0805_002124 [Coniferiporia weirii]|nr:hypothetical protein M0805_002124 [Coniferiporia weirii]
MAPPSIRNGAFSPPHSSAASYTTSVQSKLNVVSRLAIEGKVKQGADGASIKLYLKITVPVDSVTPAQILPLFAEENVKIRDFQVHPLDSDSAPYNFSSTTNPLLHNTARALNLPARSTKSYLSLFDSAAHASPTRSSSVNGSVIPPLEERYTGYFLISGYNICFALPREFPPKYRINTVGTDSDGDGLSSRSTPRTQYRSGRRASVGERSSLQFMAGLSLWIPLLSKPPRAPYMKLSIPIPRCLSNNIKVRLPSPTPISTSFASLSSDEDSGGWDLATEPHVTRTSKLGRRASVYNEFADDESSEASVAGVSENCMIRGTFTSSDIIRIRWASPLKMQDFPDQGDGRRRVGVSEVKGHMTCTILDTLPEGVKMRLDYQGTCTGVWFPGVATLLGMDVGLDANGCRITWPGNSDGQWAVDGDPALTGFTVGLPQSTLTRQNSLELPQMTIRESPDVSGLLTGETLPNGRGPSTSSASLLRAPLPTRQVSAEYSFEDSMTPTTSGLPSSVPSITTSMTRSSFGLDDMSERIARPPSTPITLQINISDLMPSAKNKFMFNISGTVIVSQSMAMYDSRDSLGTTLLLPIFRVFSAEKESVSNAVRNQCDGADVKLLESTDSLPSSKAKGTAVPYGSQVKCGLEGSEILVKPVVPKAVEEQSFSSRRGDHSLAMTSRPSSPELASAVLQSQRSVVFRDGPLVIPWVNADVVPLSPSKERKLWSYAVTVSLPTPVDGPSEWLEFGLSLPSEFSVSGALPMPEVEVICASVNGVPIRFEALGQTASGTNNLSTPGAASSSKQRWLSWVRVHIVLVGALEVVYIVKGQPGNEAHGRRGKEKAAKDGDDEVNVFIPVFSIPVSRFEISLRHSSDVTAKPGVSSSLDQTLYRKITTYNVKPFSHADIKMPHPLLASKTRASRLDRNTKRALLGFVAALPYIFSAILFSHVIGTRSELRELKAMVPGNWTEVFATAASNTVAAAETRTVTTTLTISTCKPTPIPTSTSSSSERRWFGDTYTVSYSSPAETTKVPQPPPRQTVPIIPKEASDSDEDSADPPRETSANVPMIYVPSSWPIHVRYEQAKAHVIGGWGRVWRVVEIILHWPLPVDADI